MLQNVIFSLVNIVDTIMIGQLGTAELAAVGLGGQVFMLYNNILFGLSSGAGIFVAQFWGKKDGAGIHKSTGLCLTVSLGIGAVFTFGAAAFPARLIEIFSRDVDVIRLGAEYLAYLAPMFVPFAVSCTFAIALRSVERIKLAMAASVTAILLNTILNYLFIFGPGPLPAMGVKGAAIATVIARFAEMFILVTASYAKKYPAAGSARQLCSFNKAFAAKFFPTALPVLANTLIWALAVNVQNLIFARMSTDAFAAFNIVNGTVSNLVWAGFLGLGNGAAVLVSKKIGEKNEEKARDYAWRIVRFSPLIAAASLVIFIPVYALLPVFFKVSPQAITLARIMLVIMSVSFPVRAYNSAFIVSVARAGGDTVFAALFDTIFMWFAALPAAAAAAFIAGAPVPVVYILITLEDVMKMFLGFWRSKTGAWLHNLVETL